MTAHALGMVKQRPPYLFVDERQPSPEARHAHAVGDHTAPERAIGSHDVLIPLDTVVPVVPPVFGQLPVDGPPSQVPRELPQLEPPRFDGRGRRVEPEERYRALVAEGAEHPARLLIVEQVDDQRMETTLNGFAHQRRPALERVWPERVPHQRGRARHGQCQLGDHGERPFRAGQKPAQVGSGVRPRGGLQPKHLAAGEHGGQAQHQVRSAAEPGRGGPLRRGRHPPTDGRDLQRLGIVTGGEALRGDGPLQVPALHPGLHGDGLGEVVEVEDTVQPVEIQDDRSLDRLRAPGQSGRARPRHDRRPRVARPPQDHRDLLGGLREDHGGRGRHPRSAGFSQERQRPSVAGVRGDLPVVVGDPPPGKPLGERVERVGIHGWSMTEWVSRTEFRCGPYAASRPVYATTLRFTSR